MTNETDRIQNAIRHIQTAVDIDPWAAEIAVEAMHKQIPKKPEKVEDRYCKSLYTAYCPICHWMLARGNYRTGYVDTIHKNCPECLQRIDWTEDES